MNFKELLLETIKKLMIILTFKCVRNTCMTSSCCDTNIILSPENTEIIIDDTIIRSPKKKRRASI